MRAIIAVFFGLSLLLAQGATAQEMGLPSVALSPVNIQPRPASNGAGTANFTLNPSTRQLDWQIVVNGLTSAPVALELALVGPVGVEPPINLIPNGMTDPLRGSVTLAPTEVAQLEAGRYAVILRTTTYPGGELGGLVRP